MTITDIMQQYVAMDMWLVTTTLIAGPLENDTVVTPLPTQHAILVNKPICAIDRPQTLVAKLMDATDVLPHSLTDSQRPLGPAPAALLPYKLSSYPLIVAVTMQPWLGAPVACR
jgi:hypothetical protein